MTWTLHTDTGELRGPNGNTRGTIEGPPYRTPDDVQAWAAAEFQELSMSELTTDILVEYAELWVGDVEVVNGA